MGDYENIKDQEVKVSVIMSVYNHGPYIAKAIESVIEQKTNFCFELLIGEDCSTDNTKTIIEKYEKKFPHIIKVKYWEKNVGPKENGDFLFRNAKGKYLAICEGDDYWCDKNKLQKQFDFLEQNPNFSGIYHNVYCEDENGKTSEKKEINKYPIKERQIYDFEKIRGFNLPGQTASVFSVNIYKILNRDQIELMENCNCNGDQKIAMILACIGNIMFMEDVMAVHRVILKGDSWSAKNFGRNTQYRNYVSYLEISRLAKKVFEKEYFDKNTEKIIVINSIKTIKYKLSAENINVALRIILLFIWNHLQIKR